MFFNPERSSGLKNKIKLCRLRQIKVPQHPPDTPVGPGINVR